MCSPVAQNRTCGSKTIFVHGTGVSENSLSEFTITLLVANVLVSV